MTHRKRQRMEEGGAQVAHIRRSHHSEVALADAPQASSDIVRTAYAYRGTPYVWGGERPGGFDCSGFTMHLMAKKAFRCRTRRGRSLAWGIKLTAMA